MKKKKKYKSSLRKTVNLTTGIIGLGVADKAAAAIPGTAGNIVRHGALPMAGLGLMKQAAKDLEDW